MKDTITVSLLLLHFLLVWTGCSDVSREHALIECAACSLENAPEQTIAILDSISLPEELNPSLASEWSMLYARAADRTGKQMPYVSQLQVAVNYLRETHRTHELAEAYLYLGRSYVEDKLFEKALQAYQAGLQAALQAKDYNRAGYICSYWGSLYQADDNYQQGIEKFKQSNGYFQQAGNHKSYAFGLVNEARMCFGTENSQLALKLLKQADSVAVILNDPEVTTYVYNGLACVYRDLGEYELAEFYVHRCIELDSSYVYNDNMLLSDIYQCQGKTEKALLYLKKAEEYASGDIENANIHLSYYKIEKERGCFEKALYHYEIFRLVEDSLVEVSKSINILQAEKKYDHFNLQKVNFELQQSNQNRFFLFLIVLIGCLLLVILYLLMLRKKNILILKQQQFISDQNHEIYIKTIELQQKKEELQQQALRVEESRQLLHLQDTFDEEQARYTLLKEQVESLNSYLNEKKSKSFLQSSVAKRLEKLSQTVKTTDQSALISDRYWHTIEALVAENYPTLQQELFGLSAAELHFCYLTLFRFDTKAMAILLGILPDSVSKQRLRVRQKLGLSGSDRDLYDYLISR